MKFSIPHPWDGWLSYGSAGEFFPSSQGQIGSTRIRFRGRFFALQ
ncbi:hypothetical protein D082_11650 [Synechocystis sp. PCC 6714]|nr:hypothetical protein D082_11650 [Synechocystis sp. PCC 6714]